VDVVEAQFQLRDLRLGEPALGHAHPRQVALQRRQFLGHPRDFLGRGLGGAIDQAVDRLGRGALLRHHVDGLAGEGGEDHAAQTAGRHRSQPERLDRHGGDGGLADPCITEHPEHLLCMGAMQIPVADGGNGARLRV